MRRFSTAPRASRPMPAVGAAPPPAATHGNAPSKRPAPSFAVESATNNPVLAPWSCKYFLYACNDPTADNYVSAFATLAANLAAEGTGVIAAPMPPATVRAGMCQYGGCNDTAASNYNPRVRARLLRPPPSPAPPLLLPPTLACLAPPPCAVDPPFPPPASYPLAALSPHPRSHCRRARTLPCISPRACALTVRSPPMRV